MSLRSILRLWLKVGTPAPRVRAPGFFSTDLVPNRSEDREAAARFVNSAAQLSFQRTAADFKPVFLPTVTDMASAMDAAEQIQAFALDSWNGGSLKSTWASGAGYGIPEVQIDWYASQGFIGYQMCAILSQNWLVDKACTMPAKDATRNGYELSVNDGTEVPPDLFDFVKKLDKRFKVKMHSREFVRNCRIFGIRIALFVIESEDPDYYLKPFNPDGIKAGSYKGISQVDPYWITPELDMDAVSNPASMHFYEPTFWRIGGKRYHRSHLVIIKTCEVPDVLKPTYFYGGVPLTQRIYERVYAAERTANEAPQLALSKRTTTIHVDLAAAAANQKGLEEKLDRWAQFRDNFATRVLGLEETSEDTDTSLNDFDEVVMSQYALVCSIAGTPITKMMGNQPSGFNATGEYEEASYHEECESIQEHDVRPLVERHHICCMHSYVMPKYGLDAPIELEIEFNELDAETAAEKSERQNKDSLTAKNYADTGAVDGIDIRQKMIADEDSGWSGLSTDIPEGPRPNVVIDPGAEKTAPNAPTPKEQAPPGAGSGSAPSST